MRNIKLIKNIAYAIAFILVGGFLFWLISTIPGAKPIDERLTDTVVECQKESDAARLYVEGKVRLMAEELKATQQQIQGVKIVDAENITKVNDLELSLGLLKIAVEDLQKQLQTSDSNELAKKVAKLELDLLIFTGKANVTFQKAGELFGFLVFKTTDLEKRIVALEEKLAKQNVSTNPAKERSIIVRRCKPRLICR